MKKLKTKHFTKWQNKNGLNNNDLITAINNLEKGLSAVELGKNLFKVRVASLSKGKSGGYRTIIVFQAGSRAVFAYGFKKSEKENLSKKELSFWKSFAKTLINLTESELNNALVHGELIEIQEV